MAELQSNDVPRCGEPFEGAVNNEMPMSENVAAGEDQTFTNAGSQIVIVSNESGAPTTLDIAGAEGSDSCRDSAQSGVAIADGAVYAVGPFKPSIYSPGGSLSISVGNQDPDIRTMVLNVTGG